MPFACCEAAAPKRFECLCPALSLIGRSCIDSARSHVVLRASPNFALQVVLTVLGFLLQFSFVIFTVFSNMSTNQQRFSEEAPQPSDFVKVPISLRSRVVGLAVPCFLVRAVAACHAIRFLNDVQMAG